MKVTIKYLKDEDFDKLPYKGISDSLGIADPKTNIAYVRHTGSVLFDSITATHELEHLVDRDDLHLDENGLYHKKGFKEIIHPITKALSIVAAPFTGGLSLLYSPIADTAIAAQEGQRGLGRTALKSYGINVLGAGGGAALGGAGGSALGAAAGGAIGAGGMTALTGGSKGEIIGNALTGAAGGFGAGKAMAGQMAAPTTAATTGQVSAQQASGVAASKAGVLPGAANPSGVLGSGGGVTGGAESVFSGIADLTKKGISALTSFGKNMFGGGGGTGAAAGTAGTAGSTAGTAGGMSTLQKVGIGAGIGLLGASATKGTPEPPSYDELLSPMQKEANRRVLSGESSTAAGGAASEELQRIITSPFGQAFGTVGNDPYVQEAKRQAEIEYYGDPSSGTPGQRQRIIDRYAAMGHYEGRSGQLDALLERSDNEFLRQSNQMESEAQFRAQEQERSLRMNAIAQALGLDESQMNDLIQLAQIDVSVAALRYGIDVEDARAIRDLLGRAGGLAIGASILAGA